MLVVTVVKIREDLYIQGNWAGRGTLSAWQLVFPYLFLLLHCFDLLLVIKSSVSTMMLGVYSEMPKPISAVAHSLISCCAEFPFKSTQ